MSDLSSQLAKTADLFLEFETPENVIFGYQIAGIGSRFLSALVDTVLIVLLQTFVQLTLLLIAGLVGGASLLESGLSANSSLLFAVFGLMAFAFLWGYYIFFEILWNGQTPGKRWVGLRVIRQDGAPIDVPAALIRNLVRIIDFLPLYYGIGVITMFIDAQSRRLGDFAASTLVVYDHGVVTLDQLQRAASRLDVSTQATATPNELPIDRLSSAHVALAQEFVSRQSDLRNAPKLGLHVAHRLLDALEIPERSLTEAQALNLLKTIAGLHNESGDDF